MFNKLSMIIKTLATFFNFVKYKPKSFNKTKISSYPALFK